MRVSRSRGVSGNLQFGGALISYLARPAALLCALALPTLSFAQDAPSSELFKLDAVFVSVFKATDEGLEGAARDVEARLAKSLAERHLVVPLADIAPFEDYSAEIYLDSCPPEKAPGCAYVIGDRGDANWAVSGVIKPQGTGLLIAEVAIVDVDSARVVLQFEISLDGSNDAQFVDAVANIIHELSDKGTEDDDVRVADPDGDDGLNRLQRQAISEGLASLERDLGALVRGENMQLERPKLTAQDLANAHDTDEAPPWERLEMSAGQYRRMRNAGVPVNNWRRRLRGRMGRVLLRGDVSLGTGPFHVKYDGRWAQDTSTLVVMELDSHQEIVSGGAFSGGVEAGLGVLPWLDVSAFASSRIGSYEFQVHSESIGSARLPRDPVTVQKGSLQMGGRVTFAPMPSYTVRPTGMVAVSAWLGPSLGGVVDLNSLPVVVEPPKPVVTVIQLGPGVEIEANPDLQFFARVAASIPVGTARVWEHDELVAEPELISRGAPSGSWGVGVEAYAGIQVQLGRFFGQAKPMRP